MGVVTVKVVSISESQKCVFKNNNNNHNLQQVYTYHCTIKWFNRWRYFTLLKSY